MEENKILFEKFNDGSCMIIVHIKNGQGEIIPHIQAVHPIIYEALKSKIEGQETFSIELGTPRIVKNDKSKQL
jgi:hypothetical protein